MAEVVLLGWMRAREGRRDELVQVLRESVALVVEHEPGSIQAMVHADPKNENGVILYERYASDEAFAEHRANYERVPAYGELRVRMGELLAGPIEVQRLELLGGHARPELAAPSP